MVRPDELLADAVASRYMYPPDFPGFSADLHGHGPRGCAKGSVIYSPPDTLDFYPSGTGHSPDEPDAIKAILAETQQFVADLWFGGRRVRSSGFPVAYGADHNSLGILVGIPDDPEHVQYRIKGRRIQQVAWIEDEQRVAMTTLEVLHIDDETVLPHLRTVSRTSLADGRLISTESIVDTYQRVGGYPVPSQRRVFLTTPDGNSYDREIHFTSPVLLSTPDMVPGL